MGNNSSRLQNAKKNVSWSLINKCIYLCLNFVTRTIFINSLGNTYLGLNGLFTSILSFLSLAELGIGSAINFALYKPLVENDFQLVNALMNLYRKAYYIVGVTITILGLALTPFLHIFVNFDKSVDVNYVDIYILFLGNSVLSYFFGAYRQSLITASQLQHKTIKIDNIFSIFQVCIQGGLLYVTSNYYLYLIVPIIFGVTKNIFLYKFAGKLFPYLNNKNKRKLKEEERKNIIKNVFALSVTKISGIIYSSSDSLVISTFLNTFIVGIYSNYLMITSAVSSFILVIFNSLTASIGNLNAVADIQHKYNVFNRMLFFNYCIYGFCTICIFELANPFVYLWVGKEYILPESTVLLIAYNFLVSGLNHTCTIYKDACGLFWQTRYRTIYTAIVNVISSIILIQFLGLNGVFLGTIFAYFITIFPIDPKIVYRDVFKKRAKAFYIWYIKSLCLITLQLIMIHIINGLFSENSWLEILGKGMICTLVWATLNIILFFKTEEFKYYLYIIKVVLKRKGK